MQKRFRYFETPQPDPVPIDDPPPHPAEPLKIETPVIDMQDLEHQPASRTRISHAGVRVEPRMDSEDRRDFAREDEAALDALAELERSIRKAQR